MMRELTSVDVDVVVLCYNHEKYIEKCIRSIADQKTTYKFNILIADDCSTDGSATVVKSLMEQYPNVFLVQPQSNLGSIENARNVLSHCSSPYLALCEGDDFWVNMNKLQIQIDFLESHADFGMVHGDVAYYQNSIGKLGGSVNKSKGISFPSGDIFNDYLENHKLFVFTASVAVRRELFVSCANYNLFKQRNWLAQDLPTWLEIAQLTKIQYFDIVLSAYRLSDESASRSKDPKYMYQFHQSIFDVRYYYWELYSKSKSIKSKLDYMYSISLLSDLRIMQERDIWKKLTRHRRESEFQWELKRWLQYFYLSLILIVRRK